MENYREININDWHEVGRGSNAVTYASGDESLILKLNKLTSGEKMVANEYNLCRNVASMGISAPHVHEIVRIGDKFGIIFRNVKNKKSFSRMIADNPEKIEEYTKTFTAKCRELHSTPCDTDLFEAKADVLRKGIDKAKFIDKYKPVLYKYVDEISECTTCLHGDMQMSNVITTGKEDMWIDLSDFGYGYPMLDLGMWYFLAILNTEQRSIDLFHLGLADMRRIWDAFAKEYFGVSTAEELEEVNRKVEPFAALHMLYLGSTYGFEPGMMDYIRAKLF